MVEIEYRCADGSPFPVTFASPEAAARTWQFDRQHNPEPMSPLAREVGRLGRPGERAYGEVGLPVPSVWGPGPEANGFAYFCPEAQPPDEMAKLFEGGGRLVEKYGGALGIWREHSLPRIHETTGWLQSAGDDLSIADLATEQNYAFHLTMIPALITGNDMRLLAAVCNDVFPEEGQLVAFEISQGFPNHTLQADQRLWELGRAVRVSERLRAAIGSADPVSTTVELRNAGEERDFFSKLDAFLDEFGWRSEAWDIAYPTWREQRDGFWAQLRQMARDDVVSPEEAIARGAERREKLVAEIDGLLAGDPDAQARFHRRVDRIGPYVGVREERALWQLVIVGSLRNALLRRGASLAGRGVIDRPEDVLYLLPDEIEGGGDSFRDAVAERRAEHEKWKRVDPPEFIGGKQPDQAPEASSPGVVRGLPASRGVASGTARVIKDLADADRLEPGDVLVCVTTSPPWTPLFAIAGAVVGDYGDLGSHLAIAAREYGIPCVVGTKLGTNTVPDGAAVTVDGIEGTATWQT